MPNEYTSWDLEGAENGASTRVDAPEVFRSAYSGQVKGLIGFLQFFNDAFTDCRNEVFRIVVLLFPDKSDGRLHDFFGAGDFFVRAAAALAVGAVFSALVYARIEFHNISSEGDVSKAFSDRRCT